LKGSIQTITSENTWHVTLGYGRVAVGWVIEGSDSRVTVIGTGELSDGDGNLYALCCRDGVDIQVKRRSLSALGTTVEGFSRF